MTLHIIRFVKNVTVACLITVAFGAAPSRASSLAMISEVGWPSTAAPWWLALSGTIRARQCGPGLHLQRGTQSGRTFCHVVGYCFLDNAWCLEPATWRVDGRNDNETSPLGSFLGGWYFTPLLRYKKYLPYPLGKCEEWIFHRRTL